MKIKLFFSPFSYPGRGVGGGGRYSHGPTLCRKRPFSTDWSWTHNNWEARRPANWIHTLATLSPIYMSVQYLCGPRERYEMSSILADQWRPRIWAQMQPICTAMHKIWSPTTVNFGGNLWCWRLKWTVTVPKQCYISRNEFSKDRQENQDARKNISIMLTMNQIRNQKYYKLSEAFNLCIRTTFCTLVSFHLVGSAHAV